MECRATQLQRVFTVALDDATSMAATRCSFNGALRDASSTGCSFVAYIFNGGLHEAASVDCGTVLIHGLRHDAFPQWIATRCSFTGVLHASTSMELQWSAARRSFNGSSL